MRTTITALMVGALLLSAPIAMAADADEDFAREGGYISLSALVAFDTTQQADLGGATFLPIKVDPGYGLTLRGGWRHMDHLSSELVLDVMIDRDYKVAGLTFLSSTTVAGSFQLKAPILTGRIQPYAVAGAGIFYFMQSATADDWVRFQLRGGLGLDVYVTRNWVFNIEGLYQYPTRRVNGVRVRDVLLTTGIAYRF